MRKIFLTLILFAATSVMCKNSDNIIILNKNQHSSETAVPLTHVDADRLAWSLIVATAVNKYFKKPYTHGDEFNPIQCSEGAPPVYRPNHSLAHGMRQAYLAVDIVLFMGKAKLEDFKDLEDQAFYTWIKEKLKDPKFLKKIEFANAFQRTGRQSEVGRGKDKARYENYLKSDQTNFETEINTLPFSLFNEELDLYKAAIIAKPNANLSTDLRFLSKIFYTAHLLDLRRIPSFQKDRIFDEISESLFNVKFESLTDVQKRLITRLWNRSGAYLRATGDRDLDQKRDNWDSKIFCEQAHNPKLLVHALQLTRTKPEKKLLKSIVEHTQVIRELKDKFNVRPQKEKDTPEIAKLRQTFQNAPYTGSEAYLKIYLGDRYEEIELNAPEQKAQEITLRNIRNFLVGRIKNPDAQYLQTLVDCMMEERRNRDKTVIYHATEPELGFLYDVYTELRNQLIMEGKDPTRTLRIIDTEFFKLDEAAQQSSKNSSNKATISDFVKKFKGIQDSDSTYQAMGLSTNILFGSDQKENSDTYNMFYKVNEKGITLKPPRVDRFFDYVAIKTGIHADFSKYASLMKKFVMTCQGGAPCRNGRLIQIFVDPVVLDKIAYPSIIWGYPIIRAEQNSEQRLTLQEIMPSLRHDPKTFQHTFLPQMYAHTHASSLQDKWAIGKGPDSIGNFQLENFQIRLFMRPEVMLNRNLIQVKSYWRFDPPEDLKTYYSSIKKLVNKSLVAWLQKGSPSEQNTLLPETTKIKKFTKTIYKGATGTKAPKAPPLTLEDQFIYLLSDKKVDMAAKMLNEHYNDLSKKSFSITENDFSILKTDLKGVIKKFKSEQILDIAVEKGLYKNGDLVKNFLTDHFPDAQSHWKVDFFENISHYNDRNLVEKAFQLFEKNFITKDANVFEAMNIITVFIERKIDELLIKSSALIFEKIGIFNIPKYLKAIIEIPLSDRNDVIQDIVQYVINPKKQPKKYISSIQSWIDKIVEKAHQMRLLSSDERTRAWEKMSEIALKSNNWADALYDVNSQEEMESIEKSDPFDNLGLTPRQKEIVKNTQARNPSVLIAGGGNSFATKDEMEELVKLGIFEAGVSIMSGRYSKYELKKLF